MARDKKQCQEIYTVKIKSSGLNFFIIFIFIFIFILFSIFLFLELRVSVSHIVQKKDVKDSQRI